MGESFSVFVLFKHRRLTIGRNIPTLAAARELAEAVRALRLRDPDDVIVVDDRTGGVLGPDGVVRASDRPSSDVAPTPSTAPRSLPGAPLREAEDAVAQALGLLRAAALQGYAVDGAIARLESAREELVQSRPQAMPLTGKRKT